jgi:hypothetical protein
MREVEMWRIEFLDQLWQKARENPISINKLGVGVCAY